MKMLRDGSEPHAVGGRVPPRSLIVFAEVLYGRG